jgi:hypothetical protein
MAGFGGTRLGKMFFASAAFNQKKPLLEKAGAYRKCKTKNSWQ